MKSVKSFFFTDIVFINKLWMYIKYLYLTKNKVELNSVCMKTGLGELSDEILNDDTRMKLLTYYREKSGDIKYIIPESFFQTEYFKELVKIDNLSKIFSGVFNNPTIDTTDVRCIYKDEFERNILKGIDMIKPSMLVSKSDFVNGISSLLDDTDIHVELTLHDSDDIVSLIETLKDRRNSNITVNVIITFMSDIDLINNLIRVKKINIIDTRVADSGV